jgi:hypothetical protein
MRLGFKIVTLVSLNPHLEELGCLVLLLSQVQVHQLNILQAHLLDVPCTKLTNARN